MNPNQQNLLELATKGDSRAIAALINRSLQPKGITAKVNLKSSCLQILIESDKAIDQEPITQFLVRGIKKLNVESINSIKIFSKQSGQSFPDWTKDISLRSSLEKSKTQESSLVSNPSTLEKSQISNTPSSKKADNSVLRTNRQNTGENSKVDIWTKSKLVTFSALKFTWKWYLSAFKSRPDLPLFLSPRLYGIIFTFLAFFWITALLGWYEDTTTSTSTSTPSNSSSINLSPSCDSAGGRIWTNVRLYQDSGCSRPLAAVVGGGRLRNGERGVLIQFDTGELEWKTRNAVINQTYVKTDDPAHSARLWRDIDQ